MISITKIRQSHICVIFISKILVLSQDAGNYCRIPANGDGEFGPFCYTNLPELRWQECDVPLCGKDNFIVTTPYLTYINALSSNTRCGHNNEFSI